MPRGNHTALWIPTAKDIFRSRWKRFYKRCYRPRTAGNLVDRPAPHEQGKFNYDGVPAPWKLRVSLRDVEQQPPDSRRLAWQMYRNNFYDYMRPYRVMIGADNSKARDDQGQQRSMSSQMKPLGDSDAVNHVLRCLDPGTRRRCDSGYGRPETMQEFSPESVPEHVYNEIADRAKLTGPKAQDFLSGLEERAGMKDGGFETFPIGRFYELCEEKEIMWHDVVVNPRGKPLNDRRKQGPDQKGDAEKGPDRGHFPYIDEQASLVDELRLDEVLRLRHRRSERRHPKWIEKAYQCRQRHKKYLHRRAINNDEVKERMGVLKQGLASTE